MADNKKRLAIRRLLRLEDGTVGFVFVDALTGEVLDNLSNHYLQDANGTPVSGDTGEPVSEEKIDTEPLRSAGNYREGAWGGGRNPHAVHDISGTKIGEFLNNKVEQIGNIKPIENIGNAFTNVTNRVLGRETQTLDTNVFPEASQINMEPVSAQLPEDDELYYFQDIPKDVQARTDTGMTTVDVSNADASQGDGSSLGVGMGKDLQVLDPNKNIIRNNPLVDLDNLAPQTTDMLNKMAANTADPITVLSGYRSKEYNNEIYRKRGRKPTDSTHSYGLSFDISLEGMTDEQKTEMVQRAIMSGAKTIGAYPSGNSLHVDTSQRYEPLEKYAEEQSGVTAMYNYSRSYYEQAPDWFRKGIATAPKSTVPEQRPDNPFGEDIASATQEPVLQTFAKQMIQEAKGMRFEQLDDLSTMTPAEFQTTIYQVKRDAEERANMAFTIAGEMTPDQLEALQQGDPIARAEFANIMSSMENRAFSEKLNKDGEAGLDDVLTPNNYNSLMQTRLENGSIPIEVTRGNYEIFGNTLLDAVDDYYDGQIDPTQPKTTHYASNKAKPYWEHLATGGMTPVGDHKFGEILRGDRSGVEYSPSTSFFDARDRAVDTYSYDAVNNQVRRSGAGVPSSLVSRSPLYNESAAGMINNQVSSNIGLNNSSLTSSAPDFTSYNSGTSGQSDLGTTSRSSGLIGASSDSYSSGYGAGDYSYNSGTSGTNDLGVSSGSGIAGYTSSTGGNYSSGTGSSDAARNYTSSKSSTTSNNTNKSIMGHTSSTGGNYSTGTGSSGAAQSYSSSKESNSSKAYKSITGEGLF